MIHWQNRSFVTRIIAAIVLLIGANSLAVGADDHHAQGKITSEHAREVALKAYPGKLISEELEQEAGGSGLRYSFVISHDSVQHEVGVDANTGLVLENSVEGGNPD